MWIVKTGLGLPLRLGLRLVQASPVYDCSDFDCVIKTCNQGTAAPPHFLVHVYCRQTAGWINMPFGMDCMEVRVGPDHIVLDGNPAPP